MSFEALQISMKSLKILSSKLDYHNYRIATRWSVSFCTMTYSTVVILLMAVLMYVECSMYIDGIATACGSAHS